MTGGNLRPKESGRGAGKGLGSAGDTVGSYRDVRSRGALGLGPCVSEPYAALHVTLGPLQTGPFSRTTDLGRGRPRTRPRSSGSGFNPFKQRGKGKEGPAGAPSPTPRLSAHQERERQSSRMTFKPSGVMVPTSLPGKPRLGGGKRSPCQSHSPRVKRGRFPREGHGPRSPR